MAPREKLPKCPGCKKVVKEGSPNYKGPQWHSKCFKKKYPEYYKKEGSLK